jgi:hypothetical protein
MPSFSDWPEGPLDAAQRGFDLLVMPPAPLGFDGRQVDGCPPRLLPLDELKRWLLRRGTPARVRDVVWRELVVRARREGPAWMVAAVGVAMPGLRAMAGRLAAGYAGDTDDVDAELLAGFVRKLRELDVEAPKVLLRLLWAAERAGRKVRYAQVSTEPLEFEPAGPRMPLLPWGHPDLVLASAVRAAVIDTDEAAMIAATRLEGVPVEVAATWWGIAPQLASQWRKVAEGRLVEAIRAGELSGVAVRPRSAADPDEQARRNGLHRRRPTRPGVAAVAVAVATGRVPVGGAAALRAGGRA